MPSLEHSEPAENPVIAIVEDEVGVAQVLSDLVSSIGYSPLVCASALAVKTLLDHQRPELVLLDRQLPDGDGISLVGAITSKDIPLIVLTGKGTEIDRVTGLEVGADDYIVKPFSVHEVAARIRAVLRRSGRGPLVAENAQERARAQIKEGYAFGTYLMDCQKRRVLDANAQNIDLTVAEFDLLQTIVGASGRVLSRDQILEMTHSTNIEVFDRTIDVLIFRLRRKIEVNPQSPTILKTERGVGYKLGIGVEKLC